MHVEEHTVHMREMRATTLVMTRVVMDMMAITWVITRVMMVMMAIAWSLLGL
jgi:hypothetical protein